jgi:hypothetical protein
MSALKQVFPRVHYRYDECPYAADLEDFAAWLCERAYRNKRARTHLYNVQQVLISLALPSGSKLKLAKLEVAFRRSGNARLRYQLDNHEITAAQVRAAARLGHPLGFINCYKFLKQCRLEAAARSAIHKKRKWRVDRHTTVRIRINSIFKRHPRFSELQIIRELGTGKVRSPKWIKRVIAECRSGAALDRHRRENRRQRLMKAANRSSRKKTRFKQPRSETGRFTSLTVPNATKRNNISPGMTPKGVRYRLNRTRTGLCR